MNAHFTPGEFVDALDRPLPASRQAHLAVCSMCAEQLQEMRAVLVDVEGTGDVPEPSPLFWDHLSARVHAAVQEAPAPVAWWHVGWRSWVAVASMAVLVTVAVVAQRNAMRLVTKPSPAVETSATFALGPESEAMWDMISSLAPGMQADQVADAGLMPGHGAADAMIATLTDDQRRELVRLLRAEMGAE